MGKQLKAKNNGVQRPEAGKDRIRGLEVETQAL